MEPVEFAEANTNYVADGCGDLPAWRGEDTAGQARIISCWRLTWREWLKMLLTGKVWLDVYGTMQPPVALILDKPSVVAKPPVT